MPAYDCRKVPAFGTVRFPCPVRIIDARTGDVIPEVFFAETTAGRVGRRVRGANGQLLVHPDGTHFIEVYEHRPWRAVALADGRVLVMSEGAGGDSTQAGQAS